MTGAAALSFGPTSRQLTARLLSPLAGALVFASLTRLSGGPRAGAVLGYLVALAVVAVLTQPLHRRQGITVDPYGVVVCRGYGTTRMAWDEIRAVDVRRTWAGSELVVLRTRTGDLKSPYPATHLLGRDPDFAAKVAGLRGWLAAYGLRVAPQGQS